MHSYAIKGGIGDFLQCLPFAIKHPKNRYYVVSHSNVATEFFAEFGIDVIEVPLGRLPDVPLCPRELFFDPSPFPSPRPVFSGRRPVVGVHLGASNYSLGTEKRFGFPPKELPRKILYGLAAGDPWFDLLIFGSSSEIGDLADSSNAKIVRGNLVDCLAQVAECTAFIGSDSAFKTMSAMLRIPTVVMIGDYYDEHRDGRFIDPYVEEGVVATFRYRDLNVEAGAAVAFCLEQLERQCSVCLT